MRFRAGSLFSGIAGLDIAVEEWFGYEIVWLCENDPNPRKVLARHYPGIPIYGDVRTLDFTEIEPIDLLIGGGFPCQPFSSAGKRQGESDERYLWSEVARAVRALRPRIIVLENVDAILRFREGAERICGDLVTLGYCVRWACLRASDIGAPHRRERWFAVAYARYGTGGSELREQQEIATARVGQRNKDAPQPRRERTGEARRGRSRSENDGADADRRGCSHNKEPNRRSGMEHRRTPFGNNTHGLGKYSWGTYEPAIRRWEQALGRPAPNPLIDGKLSHHFVEWMMGLPEGWTEPLSRTAALKALGNAAVPQQAYVALAGLGEQLLAQGVAS